MTSVEELTISAVRSAMAPGYELETVARSLCHRAGSNATALRIARARVERGAGWRSGPIGMRARDALTRAIDLADIDLTDSDLTDIDLAAADSDPDIDLAGADELNLSRTWPDQGAGGLAHQ